MQPADGEFYTVTELNTHVRELVEDTFPEVSVLGEVSNFKRHTSGHLYFTLKDAGAQLRAVCFRGDAARLKTEIADGKKVVASGRLTVYEAYGQYQIVARVIREAGEGELEKAFRELKAKLESEGLFDAERKRDLPPYPRRIAVITSPTGAAVRDVVSTVGRRWPAAELLVFPVHVQGPQAGPEIVRALGALAGVGGGVDVAIVGRGGGSLEDLWAFNEEPVARAIAGCAVPVISAVGHETDFTIADFVADVRAATPTMAAEIATPNRDDVLDRVNDRVGWLQRYINNRIRLECARLREMLRSYALGRVQNRLESSMQSLDFLTDRLERSVRGALRDRLAAFDNVRVRLEALNPREILSRGYTICSDASSGALVRNADDAVTTRNIVVTFHDGAVTSEAKEKVQ
jgi:exodeoxyribonuclease VII large subunit